MNEHPYTYIILRYVHDTTTEEFVNVGVLLSCPESEYADAILQTAPGRASRMFPGMDLDHFRIVIDHLRCRFDQFGSHMRDEFELGKASRNAQELAFSVIPPADSAFQWSAMGSGLSSDPQSTLKTIYERMVTRYEESHPPIEHATAPNRECADESTLIDLNRLQKDVDG